MYNFIEKLNKDSFKLYMSDIMMSFNKSELTDLTTIYNKCFPLIGSTLVSEMIDYFQLLFFAVYNEDLPCSYLVDSQNIYPVLEDGNINFQRMTYIKNKLKDLWETYSYELTIDKPKKLLELYNIRVYYGNSYSISYSDMQNIKDEVRRILNDDEIRFINNMIGSNDTTITDNTVKEIININNTFPNMLTSDRIVLYSALLNFKKVSSNTFNLIKNASGVQFIIHENWKEYYTLFNEILRKLDVVLLHF